MRIGTLAPPWLPVPRPACGGSRVGARRVGTEARRNGSGRDRVHHGGQHESGAPPAVMESVPPSLEDAGGKSDRRRRPGPPTVPELGGGLLLGRRDGGNHVRMYKRMLPSLDVDADAVVTKEDM